MWIKDKTVKPEVDSLVVIVKQSQDGVTDYDTATFVKTTDGREAFDTFALGLLSFDEIDAYMPFEKYEADEIQAYKSFADQQA